MVSFNRNIANEPFFPIGPHSRNYRCGTDLFIERHPPSRDWLIEISVAWDRLLFSIGNIQSSTPARMRESRNAVRAQPDFPKLLVSILNRFQLLMWMYESQAENLEANAIFAERLKRIQASIQRDLVRLRKLVSESSFQSRLCLRTTNLAEELEAFLRLFQA